MPVDTLKSWIIVGAIFCITILYGMKRLAGMLFVETMNKFNVGRNAASFPYTFATFMQVISGPAFGYLGKVIGVTNTIMIGSWLCTIGIGACFFVENVSLITLFYGIIFGSGCGSLLLLPTLLNQHFIKYRGIAAGFYSSGLSLGLFILPPLTELLFKTYGLSGAFLILSAMMFNSVPATLTIKSMQKKSQTKILIVKQEYTKEEIQPLLTEKNVTTVGKTESIDSNNWKNVFEERVFNSNSKPTILNNSSCHNATLESYQTFKTLRKSDFLPSTPSIGNTVKSCIVDNYRIVRQEKNNNVLSDRKPITPGINKSQKQIKNNVFSILFDPVFLLVAMQYSFFVFSTLCLTTVILDFANDIGVPENIQSYTLMTFSLGELFGPLLTSWIIDKSYISKPNLLILSCFLQGPIYILFPFSNGAIILLCLLYTLGFVHSPGLYITPLLVGDYVDLEKQTVAMTSLSILLLPFSLLVSPIIGYLRDDIGSYDYLFYGLGIIAFIRGFSVLIIPHLGKRRRGKYIILGK